MTFKPLSDKEKKKQYDKEYNSRPEVIARKAEQNKKYREKNKQSISAKRKERYQKNKKSIIEKNYEYKRKVGFRYPKKLEAYKRYRSKPENKVKESVRSLSRYRYKKLGVCSDCNSVGKTEFHHYQYTADTIIEVCKKCHYKHH